MSILEEIIKLAHEAGFSGSAARMWPEYFIAFAALVAAAEREACAKIAFDGYDQRLDGDEIGAAIRARGENT